MSETRTPLFARNQSGGAWVIDDIKQHPGAIWFVDSGNTSNGADSAGYGRTPDVPFLTLDYAVGKCTASQGDVIYLMPGHADTSSDAADIALDVIGISVIGLGNGSLTPTITFDTATDADIDIDAADITIENVHFIANFADIVAVIDVNADDFTLRNCRFSEAGTDLNALIWVQDAAAAGSDRITIDGCRALTLDAANTHFVNFAGTGDGHRIIDNELIGDWGTMAVGGAGVVTNVMIARNIINNAASDNDSCINVSATTTGMVAYNACGGAAAQANGITAPDCVAIENYYGVINEDLSGILEPAAT